MTNTDALHYRSLSSVAADIGSGTRSSEEVTRHTLDRIEALEPRLPLGAAPLLAHTVPFNLAGIPSLTLPIGRAPSGAPLGFQLLAPDLAEDALLSAGAAYEAAAGYSAEHPAV